MTLRGGHAIDKYDVAAPYEPETDQPSDAYLETYAYWGLSYLDPASWRHDLPCLIGLRAPARGRTRGAGHRRPAVVDAPSRPEARAARLDLGGASPLP